MIKKFKKFIQENALFTKEDKVLLAVSGGVDSIVLCVLMKQADYNFGIAHCNYQLRGEDSDGDAEFVKKVADFLDVPLHVQNFDTETLAKERKESIQICARNLRYTWFNELLETEKYNWVADSDTVIKYCPEKLDINKANLRHIRAHFPKYNNMSLGQIKKQAILNKL